MKVFGQQSSDKWGLPASTLLPSDETQNGRVDSDDHNDPDYQVARTAEGEGPLFYLELAASKSALKDGSASIASSSTEIDPRMRRGSGCALEFLDRPQANHSAAASPSGKIPIPVANPTATASPPISIRSCPSRGNRTVSLTKFASTPCSMNRCAIRALAPNSRS
jgi:hypothetical protein